MAEAIKSPDCTSIKCCDPMNSTHFAFKKYFYQLSKEGNSNNPTAIRTTQVDAYNQWCDHIGVRHPKCGYPFQFYTRDGFPYPGLVALDNIEPYERIVEVNSSKLITAYKAYHSPIKHVYNSIPCIPQKDEEVMVMAIYIAFEMSLKEKSEYYQMFEMWPKEEHLLFTWPHDQLKELQCKNLMMEALKDSQIYGQYYLKYEELLMKFPKYFAKEMISKSKFDYIIQMILSRMFSHGGTSVFLSPFADAANHNIVDCYYSLNDPEDESKEGDEVSSEEDNSAIEIKQVGYQMPEYVVPKSVIQCNKQTPKHTFSISSNSSSFKKGEQIYIHYGKNRCNGELLSSYGFCMEFNKYEFTCIHIKFEDKHKYPIAYKEFEMKASSPKIAIRVYYQKYTLIAIFGDDAFISNSL